ncbi:unnamed protein product [Paramecium sonneborni]|uniref:Uncharacterized protein n=1 Tax=Paramecium sonneborni TaxID=65129 RepID=A0A8S1K1J4_9CILI|nr:unnamed protein product [Paramecium sonneborni]
MGSYPSYCCCPQSYSNKEQQNKISNDELQLNQFKKPFFNQVVQINPEDDSPLLQIIATYEQLIKKKSISTSYNCSSNKRSRSISVDNKNQIHQESLVNTKHWKRKKMAYQRSLSASQFINSISKQGTAYKPSSILKKRSNTQESQFQKKSKNKVSFLPFILQCNTSKMIDYF